MSEEHNEQNNSSVNTLLLNTAIGFLSVLLIFLIIALSIRVLYPRILNQRAEAQTELISDVIQIEVLNGCGIAGIANRFTGVLRSNGFDVVETGNFDHIIPLALGGINDVTNIQLLCESCNKSKGANKISTSTKYERWY